MTDDIEKDDDDIVPDETPPLPPDEPVKTDPVPDEVTAFRPPTGETLEAVIRDAARQVIAGYGPALRKLACS